MLTAGNKKPTDPIAAALAVLARSGVDALTTRAIAAQAGVSPTALYRHFTNREALIDAVVAETYKMFRRALISTVPVGGDGAWLRVAFDRYLRFALDHPNHYRLLFASEHGHVDRYPHDFLVGGTSGFRALRDLVLACMESGTLTRGEPGDVALTLYAHMHGLIMLHLAGRFSHDDEKFAEFFHRSMEQIVAGLR